MSAPGRSDRLAGLAHVASCSFLASRLSPSAQFWLALGGGVALARAGARHGVRAGYGASLAAIVQTIAMIGPARVNGPLTQALNAPLVGAMLGRGRPLFPVILACLAIRLAHYAVLNVLFVWIVVGGLEEYVATYDKIAGFFRILPTGQAAAIVFTVIAALGWALFYSVVQVIAYRRALRRWPPVDEGAVLEPTAVTATHPAGARAWAVMITAVALFATLLTSTQWPVVGGVAGVLAVLWIAARAFDLQTVKIGAALAAVFAVGALGPAILGAVPWGEALPRAARAALLVLVATWARAAAGAEGVRRVARRVLQTLRARESAALIGALESDRRLLPAGRALIDELRDVPKEIVPVADALTAWVAAESARHP